MDDPLETLFAEYLRRLESEESLSLDELCDQNPEHAEGLRRLDADYGRIQAFRSRIGLADKPDSKAAGPSDVELLKRQRRARALYEEVVRRLSARQSHFERLTDEGEIAVGGMGAIRRVVDEDLRRTLAMKVLKRTEGVAVGDVDPVNFGRFLDEAQVTAQLDHPGIVPVHELGLDDNGQVYFTMKLVKGKTLHEIYRETHRGVGEWTNTRILGALLQVCQAMAYAHDKRVIHRDLKPANIMVGRYGEVYVMDWGLARLLDKEDERDLRLIPASATTTHLASERHDHADKSADSPLYTMDGTIVGTPAFMSPEQAKGALEEVGPPADIYAVGALLYQLLTGRMPYIPADERIDPWAVLAAIQQGPPAPVHELAPEASAEIVAICEKAMAREPADRYASMLDLAGDLRAYLERRVVGAYETGAIAELRKWVARNKMTAAALFAALIAVVGGLAISRMAEVSAKEEIDLASDFYRIDYLWEEADDLWPATPDKEREMEEWIAKAQGFLARRAEHQRRQRAMRASTGGAQEDIDNREEVVAMLDALEGSNGEPGLLASMIERLDLASSLRERTLESTEAKDAWDRAIRSIANETENPHYGGLALTPQLGLWPLGQDPATGLWEFAHAASGELPVWAGDRWAVEEDTCLVFVLIPKGSFWMGTDPDAKFFGSPKTPDSEREEIPISKKEGPRHKVFLDAFFLSKYEMTQGQWLAVEESNPAFFTEDNDFGGTLYDLTHPVENVDWEDCEDALGKLGLTFPTEAQWEYAARGGTDTAWWTGDDYLDLRGAVNLIDMHAKKYGPTSWPYERDFDDDYTTTAPVDEFRPNDFGLHNVLGNVWEWTADYFAEYDQDPEARDGRRGREETPTHVSRGGAFYNQVAALRCAYRFEFPGFRVAYGVRPALMIAR